MRKNNRISVLLLAFFSVFLLSGCGAEKEEEPVEAPKSAPAVETQSVSLGSIATEHSIAGKIASGDESSVYVSVSARCTKVFVEVGDTISAGAPICTLDLSTLQSNYELASLNYQNTLQNYNDQSELLDKQIAQYEKNYNDALALFEIGAASQADVDNARLTLESAQVSRSASLSQLDLAMKNYQATMDQITTSLENINSNGTVSSPITGTVLSLSAAENSFVSSSMPVAVIDSTKDMEVLVSVSESLISKIHVGDPANVSISALGTSFEGNIRNIEKSANAQTNLYDVTLSIPSGIKGLLTGMFADVTFYTDTREGTVVVPTESILIDDNGQYVFTLDGDSIAHRVSVSTGLTGNGVTEVTDGLYGGETLVVVGQAYLTDGEGARVVSPEE